MNFYTVQEEILMSEDKKEKKLRIGEIESEIIGTHNGIFHPDDVFGCAAIKLAYPDKFLKIVRTREPNQLENCFCCVDVGFKYNPDKNQFDHHQNDSTIPRRTNGIPYAAFGLIWLKFGEMLCGSKEAADLVEERLVIPIDAADNGIQLSVSKRNDGYKDYGFHNFVNLCQPFDEKNPDYDTPFFQLMLESMAILQMEIYRAKKAIIDLRTIQKIYEEMDHPEILVLDGDYNWKKWIDSFPKLLFVIHPYEKDDWGISTVRISKNSLYEYRKMLPAQWLDEMSDEELKFVHKKLFFAKLKSKEQAIARAIEAVKTGEKHEESSQ